MAKAKDQKYIKGLDGRILKIRSAHSSLNVLLQSAGALVMKQYLVMLDTNLQKEFRRWASNYIVSKQEETPKAPPLPQTYLEALEDLVAKEKPLLEQAPKVEAYEDLTHQNVDTLNDMTLTEVAKELGWKPKAEFMPMLRKADVIFQKGTEPKFVYVQKGWFRGTPYNKGSYAGMSWKVTPRGMAKK